MNVTPKEKQIRVLSALVEGNSIRSTERMMGVHRDTIMRLLVRVGKRCQEMSDQYFADYHCERIEADEIWTFVYKKERHLTKTDFYKNPTYGDQFVFVAFDPDTKLVPVHMVGKRTRRTTNQFVWKLHAKVKNNGRIQITTDGLTTYIGAIDDAFGCEVDYAQLIKTFASDYIGPGRYAPPRIEEATPIVIQGEPDRKHICTSYVERNNLTMRMCIRRLTRLTNAFSKKLENLKAAVSLHFWHYNFMRIHGTLRVTPAMEARVTDHVWGWDETVELAD